MDEYLCLTLLSRAGEGEAAFKGRLSAFWTRMLREEPGAFERVYAEAAAFDAAGGAVLGRRYLIEAGAAVALEAALAAADVAHRPLDPDDVYTKYEAAPPEWTWIEH